MKNPERGHTRRDIIKTTAARLGGIALVTAGLTITVNSAVAEFRGPSLPAIQQAQAADDARDREIQEAIAMQGANMPQQSDILDEPRLMDSVDALRFESRFDDTMQTAGGITIFGIGVLPFRKPGEDKRWDQEMAAQDAMLAAFQQNENA